MASRINKKLFLTSTLLIFLIASLSLTVTYAAPSPNYAVAKFRYNGTYNEVHNSSAIAPWESYKVYCLKDSLLNVTITFDYTLVNISINIFNSSEDSLNQTSGPPLGSASCSITCSYTGYYYPCMYASPDSVARSFVLIISGSVDAPSTPPPIPGFELVFLILSLMMAISLITFLGNRKKNQLVLN